MQDAMQCNAIGTAAIPLLLWRDERLQPHSEVFARDDPVYVLRHLRPRCSGSARAAHATDVVCFDHSKVIWP